MGLFSKKYDKDVVDMIVKENKKLKKENTLLKNQINGIKDCKDKYEVLIEELEEIKERYKEKIKSFDLFEDEFKKELERINKTK